MLLQDVQYTHRSHTHTHLLQFQTLQSNIHHVRLDSSQSTEAAHLRHVIKIPDPVLDLPASEQIRPASYLRCRYDDARCFSLGEKQQKHRTEVSYWRENPAYCLPEQRNQHELHLPSHACWLVRPGSVVLRLKTSAVFEIEYCSTVRNADRVVCPTKRNAKNATPKE